MTFHCGFKKVAKTALVKPCMPNKYVPKSIIKKVNLEENDELIIEQQDGKIVIFPAKKKLSLIDMMDQVTPENLHGEGDFKPEGNDVW